jgi:hypothetical protein
MQLATFGGLRTSLHGTVSLNHCQRSLLLKRKHVTLEFFTTMKILVVVFWVMTPCNDVVGYRRFGGTCYLHLLGLFHFLYSLKFTYKGHNPHPLPTGPDGTTFVLYPTSMSTSKALSLHPEDGGNKALRHVSILTTTLYGV